MASKNQPDVGRQDRSVPGGYEGGYGPTNSALPPPGYQQQQRARYDDYGMQMCYRGQHDWRAEYGLGGILCAIFCFPCGLLGLCIDRELICRRCGARQP